MQSFIRAINNKGKHFDINYELGVGTFYTIKEYAENGWQLPDTWKKEWRSLNEMYLSFMDPNGEIIVFQFIDWPVIGAVPQIYFHDGPEKRILRVENTELEFTYGWDSDSPVSDSFCWPNHNIDGRSIEIPYTKQEASGFRKKLSDCTEKASLPEIPFIDFGNRRTVSDHHEVGPEKYRVPLRRPTDSGDKSWGDRMVDFIKFRQEYDVSFEQPTILGLAKEKKCREE
jgi:hypothetical protein